MNKKIMILLAAVLTAAAIQTKALAQTRNILSEVQVEQSPSVAAALNEHIFTNRTRTVSGYRVRIFFDNGQSARTGAANAMAAFSAKHPGVAVYTAYVNPYFKVTVGDFRTKSDAARMLNAIKYEFPAAFIVKENINFLPAEAKEEAADSTAVTRILPIE